MRTIPALAAAVFLSLGTGAIAQEVPGEPLSVPAPVTYSLAEILTRPDSGSPAVEHVRPADPEGSGALPDPEAPPFVFAGLDYISSEIQDRFRGTIERVRSQAAAYGGPEGTLPFSRINPPDPMGDIGETRALVCVNGLIRLMNRDGNTFANFEQTTDAFFNAASTVDPMVRFDRFENRWFVSMIRRNGSDILLAISDDEDGTNWRFETFSMGVPVDYVSMSVDANAVYLLC